MTKFQHHITDATRVTVGTGFDGPYLRFEARGLAIILTLSDAKLAELKQVVNS